MSDLDKVFAKYAMFCKDEPFPGSFKYRGRYLHMTIVEAALEEANNPEDHTEAPLPPQPIPRRPAKQVRETPEKRLEPAGDPLPPLPMADLLQAGVEEMRSLKVFKELRAGSDDVLAGYFEGNAPFSVVEFSIYVTTPPTTSSGIHNRAVTAGSQAYSCVGVLSVGSFKPPIIAHEGSDGPMISAPLLEKDGETVWIHVLNQVESAVILQQIPLFRDHRAKISARHAKEAEEMRKKAAEAPPPAATDARVDKLEAAVNALMAHFGVTV